MPTGLPIPLCLEVEAAPTVTATLNTISTASTNDRNFFITIILSIIRKNLTCGESDVSANAMCFSLCMH